MKKQFFISLVIFLAVFAYAVIRYNVLKGTPWIDLPLFVSNKAISLSAVIFIALSYALGSLARFWPETILSVLTFRKFFGLLGFGLAAFHAAVSLLIFTPSYYPKFFLGGEKLNLTGELSLFFGVLAFFVFTLVAISSIPAVARAMERERWLAIQRFGYLGLVLVFFHVFVMGFEGWLRPAGWPGGLLPISLIAAVVIALALLLKIAATIFSKKRIG
ncbi:MAG: ferric reductase-like transmembrane domain-containing protein [Parcubacteria group bacterium]|nr:ferric reductase-like transmembrane domain-containing protein [Parcubacteria group bacterium]